MRTGEVDTLYISRKFRVLYFFAALAIVLIHSGIMAECRSLSSGRSGSIVRTIW